MSAASEDVGIEPVQRHDSAKDLAALATADLDGQGISRSIRQRHRVLHCPVMKTVLVSIREVFWCRRCPISYSEKGDIDVQIGRRREASPSMSDFGQDRKSANPLFNKISFSGTARAWDSANASARRRP